MFLKAFKCVVCKGLPIASDAMSSQVSSVMCIPFQYCTWPKFLLEEPLSRVEALSLSAVVVITGGPVDLMCLGI